VAQKLVNNECRGPVLIFVTILLVLSMTTAPQRPHESAVISSDFISIEAERPGAGFQRGWDGAREVSEEPRMWVVGSVVPGGARGWVAGGVAEEHDGGDSGE